MTEIEWTDEVWNPVRGCAKVSEGCRNCYAMRQAHRFSGEGQPYEGLTHVVPGKGPQWTGRAVCVPEMLDKPLRWRKPRRVFVNSMSDLFHPDVPDHFIHDVFATMAGAQRHTFQVLTKRPERMQELLSGPYFPNGFREDYGERTPWPLPNVWLGVSVEDQAAADERIPHLLDTPAALRFLSCEPLLGPVQLRQSWRDFLEGWDTEAVPDWEGDPEPMQVQTERVDWVIVGGESGPSARPMHPDWVESLYGQCSRARVPFFFKQWGAWVTPAADAFGKADPEGHAPMVAFWPDGRTSEEWPAEDDGLVCTAKRVGKKAAGADLNGRLVQEMPLPVERAP